MCAMRFARFALVPLALALCATSPLPRPVLAMPRAKPAILYAHFSTLTVRPDTTWSARFITTTNVASLVFDMPFFSFEIPRRAYGDFAFSTVVQTVPALYRQTLHGSVIAYTADGRSVSLPVTVTFQ